MNVTLWVMISIGVILCGLAWFLVPYALRRVEVAACRRLCRENSALVLSFDDGPGNRLTEKVAILLGKLDISASFFVIGDRATKAPETVRKLAAAGHVVGSHTRSHMNAWKTGPVSHCLDMICGHRQVEQILGQTEFFRPPYGKMSLASLIIAKLRGFEIVWWTVDARDSLEAPRSHQEVLQTIRRDGGGIILLHDYDIFPDPNHDSYVLTLIPKIHALARELDLEFVTIADLKKCAQ